MVKIGTKKFEFPNFSFEIRPVTGRDFPVTGNPDHPRDFFPTGNQIPGNSANGVFFCIQNVMATGTCGSSFKMNY